MQTHIDLWHACFVMEFATLPITPRPRVLFEVGAFELRSDAEHFAREARVELLINELPCSSSAELEVEFEGQKTTTPLNCFGFFSIDVVPKRAPEEGPAPLRRETLMYWATQSDARFVRSDVARSNLSMSRVALQPFLPASLRHVIDHSPFKHISRTP